MLTNEQKHEAAERGAERCRMLTVECHMPWPQIPKKLRVEEKQQYGGDYICQFAGCRLAVGPKGLPLWTVQGGFDGTKVESMFFEATTPEEALTIAHPYQQFVRCSMDEGRYRLTIVSRAAVGVEGELFHVEQVAFRRADRGAA
jgi:hypothetical protein